MQCPASVSRSYQTPAVPLLQIHRLSHVAQRKHLLEALFEKWDSKACGSLDLEEVIAVLSTFKGHKGKEALMKGKEKSLLCENHTGGFNHSVTGLMRLLQAPVWFCKQS